MLAKLKGKAIISLNDHPDIRYTVGGGKGSEAKEVLMIFSWDVDAEPAGLFNQVGGTSMEIGAAVTAVKGALDLARTAKDVNDRAQLNAAMSDIMDKLTTAQSDLLDLLTEHHRLIDENRELKGQLSKEERFNQYRLSKTPVGHYIYELKEEYVNENQPAHAICVKCREDGLRSILQEDDYGYFCPTCKTVADFRRQPGFAISSGPTYDEPW
ncbi:hypothetical protein [Halomonas sp. SH5A2]|uniref:hypothetical protein n=1 Tax=Halomonas sp. SH5A2 TaxID=2749040 RepID=UPI001C904B34|nr:hypothetical protein [Halomonas sp. SH5A2]